MPLATLLRRGFPRDQAARRERYLPFTKRLLDVGVSGVTLFGTSPLLLVGGLIVRWRLGSPVLFRQIRPGLHGEPFTIYKLRTMTDARGPDGRLLSDSQRLTPFGRILRTTSLDELPELWNVLTGDMSIVGPRPLLEKYTPYFTAEERKRFSVRPGITGWAQIRGRNAASWDARLRDDVWYVEHWSLWLDLRIMFQTVIIVFTKRGLDADPRSGMRDLDDERRGRAGE